MKHLRTYAMCLTMLISALGYAQTIEGTLIESKSGEPVYYVNVLLAESKLGTQTDTSGKFTLPRKQNEPLVISAPGYATLYIINTHSTVKEVNLGKIPMIYQGLTGHIMTSERCDYIDEFREIVDEELPVSCLDGSIRFTWKRIDEKTLMVDYASFSDCEN